MKKPTWMPCYITDYLRDTTRLTTEGHGAYLLLIFDYWVQGQPLPDDDAQLAAITRMSLPKWKTLRPTLARFFQIGDGVWRHKRVDRELELATERIAKLSNAGKLGGRAKRSNATSDASINATSDASINATSDAISDAISDDSSDDGSDDGSDDTPQGAEGATGSEAATRNTKKNKTNLPLSNRETNSARVKGRDDGEASFQKISGSSGSLRSPAANAAIKKTKRDLRIQKLTDFAAQRLPEPEFAIAGLMGADPNPEHDGQWWLDELDRLEKAHRRRHDTAHSEAA